MNFHLHIPYVKIVCLQQCVDTFLLSKLLEIDRHNEKSPSLATLYCSVEDQLHSLNLHMTYVRRNVTYLESKCFYKISIHIKARTSASLRPSTKQFRINYHIAPTAIPLPSCINEVCELFTLQHQTNIRNQPLLLN